MSGHQQTEYKPREKVWNLNSYLVTVAIGLAGWGLLQDIQNGKDIASIQATLAATLKTGEKRDEDIRDWSTKIEALESRQSAFDQELKQRRPPFRDP